MYHEDDLLLKDRIVGSILGIFIGDALGVGVHWQYDLDLLQEQRGFVTDYLDPLPGTFHSGTKDAPAPGKLVAGQLEQQGVIDKLLLESLARYKALNQTDFLTRLQDDIFLGDPTMDGTRHGGRYGWTDKSICDLYQARILQQKPWNECAPPRSDTPDAIVRSALLGALYFRTPREMSVQVQQHARYTTGDSSVQSHSVAFASMVAALLDHADLALDESLSTALYNQAGKALPFSTMYSSKDFDPSYGTYSEPDSLLWFGRIAKGLQANSELRGLPNDQAYQGVLLYGQFCAFFATLPSAYYCAARFPESFEDAILCSINGGGQTTMRSSLVGALLGARVGLRGIPSRFVEGLGDHEYILELANTVADAAIANVNVSDAWNWPGKGDHLNGLPAGKLSHSKSMHMEMYPAPSAASNVFLASSSPESGVEGPVSLLVAFTLGIAFSVALTVVYGGVQRLIRKTPKYRYEQIA